MNHSTLSYCILIYLMKKLLNRNLCHFNDLKFVYIFYDTENILKKTVKFIRKPKSHIENKNK